MTAFLSIIRNNQRYLWLALFILVLSSATGYVFHDDVEPIVGEALKQLEGVAGNIQDNPTFTNAFMTIFLNNTRATFLMMLSGFVFGIFPFFSLVINGFLLGYILLEASRLEAIHPFTLFVQKILPHGVLEFPAIIIAAGFGLKFGWLIIRTIGMLTRQSRRKGAISSVFREALQQFAIVFIGVVVLLVLAAAIESSLILFVG